MEHEPDGIAIRRIPGQNDASAHDGVRVRMGRHAKLLPNRAFSGAVPVEASLPAFEACPQKPTVASEKRGLFSRLEASLHGETG